MRPGDGREARFNASCGSAARAVFRSHMRASMLAGELGPSWSVGRILDAMRGVGALTSCSQSRRVCADPFDHGLFVTVPEPSKDTGRGTGQHEEASWLVSLGNDPAMGSRRDPEVHNGARLDGTAISVTECCWVGPRCTGPEGVHKVEEPRLRPWGLEVRVS